MSCLFCQIAGKAIPASLLYEDEKLIAFEDINPQAPVHILIVPRKHIPTGLDLTEEDRALVGDVFLLAARLAREREIDADGYRVVLNTNAGAGQSVFHLHYHLLGGRLMRWPPG
ncbi:MAG: histidine triad nucleotide-binding protein [Myxococcota bacterium]